ncbi:hypothetical protein L7F22_044991 [Adiantum nelumboides]|nr:hypothetical protein [Adiantum nelumboides]
MNPSSSSNPVQFASRLSWRKRSLDDDSLHGAGLDDPALLALVNGLLTAAKELSLCKLPPFCQRYNAKTICRRASALCPLFEEIRDSGAQQQKLWLPPSALSSFRLLRTAFRNIKALIHDCRHTSILLLLMEQDLIATQFHNLTSSLTSALASLPFDLLDIAQDTREHVSLVHKHALLALASTFVDPEERLLQSEILSVLSALETQICPDAEKMKHIFETLHFNDATDCERELRLLENEREKLKREGQYAEIPNVNSLVSLMRYARCMLYGLGPEQQVGAACRKYELACASMRRVVLARVEQTEEGGGVLVPQDFLCPISLELMVDPVAISSGQTYERASISRWLDEGHTTCPKTGSKLLHNTLIPNSSLRRLIAQWCAENDYILDSVAAKKGSAQSIQEPPSTKATLEATRLTAEFLVGKLSHGSVQVQRQAAYELRLMAKDGTDNRACVAAAGAVPALATLLESGDKSTQENAVTALLNLSINDQNKGVIVQTEGALDRIVQVLTAESGATTTAMENAAATLFCISAAKEYRSQVGSRATAIDALLTMLREGSTRGKRDAAATLFNVALSGELVADLLRKDAVLAAIEALEGEGGEEVADEVAALLAVLGRGQDGLAAVSMGIGRVVGKLVGLVAEGNSRSKEFTSALLLAACCNVADGGGTAATLRQQLRRCPGILPSLRRLLTTGTPRAQRKAASLLRLLFR